MAEVVDLRAHLIAQPIRLPERRLAARVGPHQEGEVVVGVGQGHREGLTVHGHRLAGVDQPDTDLVGDRDGRREVKLHLHRLSLNRRLP